MSEMSMYLLKYGVSKMNTMLHTQVCMLSIAKLLNTSITQYSDITTHHRHRPLNSQYMYE